MIEHRLGATAVLVLLLGLVVSWLLLLGPQVKADRPAGPAATYSVAAGDTLWEIAASLTPQGGDVRQVVHDLRVINHLEADPRLRAGQVLVTSAG